MAQVYEVYTWQNYSFSKERNEIATEAARNYDGRKYTVSIGEWGVRSFLVFADSKEQAKEEALKAFHESKSGWYEDTSKIKVREVTNCKKYKSE